MILIYCPISSVRLHYTVKQLFGLLPGSIYEITDNKDAFLAANVAQINYSKETFEGVINIMPSNLLWQTTIVPQSPTVGHWEGTTTLFANNGGTLPFDIFSAVFFLLSRYEEYTDTKRDQHGRYTAQQSLAYNNSFLHLPLINIWADKLRVLLNNTFSLELKKLPYTYTSTIDIDQIFYYRYKPLARQILGGLRQLYRGEWASFWQRKLTLLGIQNDPNDVFDWLHTLHQKHNTKTLFFFLMGDAAPPYDPAPVFYKKAASTIIQHTSNHYLTGIHPSYHSFNNETILLKEKNRLEVLTKTQIKHSRQHFLLFSLPQTYRALITCGITHEYSMGYADVVGYRASIAAPFAWFDLEKNEETALTIYPFAVMDVTLKNYMKLSPNEAKETIKKLNLPVQKHGGNFMSLWHNESLSEAGNWKNWREVYQLLLTFSPENGD